MFNKGLEENAEFVSYHPLINLLYFVLVIVVTMFSLSPFFLGATFAAAWAYYLLLKGKKTLRTGLFLCVSVVIVMVAINMFFNNNGATVLFYINSNRITLESVCYGVASAVMLVSVIMWFSCFNVIMTSDKLIYVFGKAAPVLGLTLSMIFRFIPLLKNRFTEISLGQRCMGRGYSQGSLPIRTRQLLKEISILIAWSLEASIESADSMEARGYGLKGRTSFHLFKFSARDIECAALMLASGIPVLIGCVKGLTDMYFYPRLLPPEMNLTVAVMLACYGILLVIPLIIDVTGEIRWRQSGLKI